MVLQHPCHEHPLILRILSENCREECRLCQVQIHGPAYCCDDCSYFLHGSCALIELPPKVRHPSHPHHLLTLSSEEDHIYSCSKCDDASDMHVLTAIATLPPLDDEEENDDEDEDEDKEYEEEEDEENTEEEELEDADDEEEEMEEDGNEDEDEEQVEDGDDEEDEDEYDEDDDDSDDDGDEEEEEEEGEEELEDDDEEVQDEEEGMIRHFAHKKHPLVAFHVETPVVWPECAACEQRISGQVYGCRACLFLLHASCAQSPRVIDHPFGSQFTLARHKHNPVGHASDICRACAESIDDGFVYSRPDGMCGSLRLHMVCALATQFPRGHTFPNSTESEAHPSHPCPLIHLHIEEKTFAPICCRVCGLKVSGEALACPKCPFFLHKSCSEKLPEVIHHYLHPDHSLKLTGEPTQGNKDYCCASCQGSVSENDIYMAFQCDICEFYLHPDCALRTLSAVEEGAASSVSNFGHDHPLQLSFLRYNSHDCCVACEYDIDGLAYSCLTCDDIRIHKSCAELPQELDHPFHSQHPLVLLSKPSGGYFHCSICRKKSSGYAYYCEECKFNLDMECATLKLTLKHPRHEHKLAYFENMRNDQSRPCGACGKTCKSDLYLCVPCDFMLHHDCLPLLPKIKHEGHRLHPVFLRDKFVDGDPNYQYCDLCNTLRHPEHGVYRCEECWFSGHIDCMISEYKVDVEAEETEVETSENPVAYQANPKGARLKAAIDVTRRNIDIMTGSLNALMAKLKELEMQKESECSS